MFTSHFLVKVQWHSVIHSLTSILAYWLCGGSISRRAKCIQIIKIAWTRFKMSMLGLLYWLAVLLSSYIVHINNTTTFNVCAQWNIFYQQFDFVKANSFRQEPRIYCFHAFWETVNWSNEYVVYLSNKLLQNTNIGFSHTLLTATIVKVVLYYLQFFSYLGLLMILFNMQVWNIEPLKFLQTLSITAWVVGIQNRKI